MTITWIIQVHGVLQMIIMSMLLEHGEDQTMHTSMKREGGESPANNIWTIPVDGVTNFCVDNNKKV